MKRYYRRLDLIKIFETPFKFPTSETKKNESESTCSKLKSTKNIVHI